MAKDDNDNVPIEYEWVRDGLPFDKLIAAAERAAKLPASDQHVTLSNRVPRTRQEIRVLATEIRDHVPTSFRHNEA